jgi:hypothetical protein
LAFPTLNFNTSPSSACITTIQSLSAQEINVVLSENDTDKNRSYFTWLGSEMVSFFVKNDIYFCGKGILLTGKMKKKTHGS